MKRTGRVTLPKPLRIYECFVELPRELGVVHSFHVLRWYSDGRGWVALS